MSEEQTVCMANEEQETKTKSVYVFPQTQVVEV